MKLHTFLESKSKVWHRYTVYLVYLYAVIAMNQSKSQTHSINNFLSNFLSSSSLHQQLFDKKMEKPFVLSLGRAARKRLATLQSDRLRYFIFQIELGKTNGFNDV